MNPVVWIVVILVILYLLMHKLEIKKEGIIANRQVRDDPQDKNFDPTYL